MAKIVKSTNSKYVILVLRDTYNLFDYPFRQKSVNEPPFNSNEMIKFAKNRNIAQVKIPPGHPAASNSETVMKPLGKAMKIGNMQNLPEQEILSAFLTCHRDARHVSTGVQSAHMLFRDGYRKNLPHHKTPDNKIREASHIKKERKSTWNSSRHTVDMNYKIGDQVLPSTL